MLPPPRMAPTASVYEYWCVFFWNFCDFIINKDIGKDSITKEGKGDWVGNTRLTEKDY